MGHFKLMADDRDFFIHPPLRVRGEPRRDIHSLPETARTIRSIDEAVAYASEYQGRERLHRDDVIRRLREATNREQKLDAVNAFRAWLEAEDLLFPQHYTDR
jgi:hypothetical protein